MGNELRVRDIVSDGELIAQVFDFSISGPVIFPTPELAEMQCGFGEVLAEKDIRAHVHNITERNTKNTSEFIFVLDGRMDIVVLNCVGVAIDQVSILPQTGFLQYIGGHKIKIAKGTKYFELKQGPYLGQNADKTVLVNI